MNRRRSARVFFLYVRALLREFRWTFFVTAIAVAFMAFLLVITPHSELGGARPSLRLALYGGWMALLGEPILAPPETWYLTIADGMYPLLGFAIVGEGIVHFGMLMTSRRRGEKEWIRVMASTYRDHVILCGVGRLGIRVLEQLRAMNQEVVVIEKDEHARFLPNARDMHVPVLVRDMSEDQALLDAGVERARAIVVATNDDVGNLEVAIDARRMNRHIRVILRMFEQSIANKLAGVFGIDAAFSASALAAPSVAGLTLGARVLSMCKIAGVEHVATELDVVAGSAMLGKSVRELEDQHGVRFLARTPRGGPVETPPHGSTSLAAGDVVVLHAPLARVPALTAAARA